MRGRIAEACGRAGRDPAGVRLVAITKSVGMDAIRALVELGVRELGENRPLELARRAQEAAGDGATAGVLSPLSPRSELPIPSCHAAGPAPALAGGIEWHLVGHLQRNKIRRTLPHVAWIQSIDSARLIRALGAEIRKSGQAPPRVLIEINVAGEARKTGLSPGELDPVLAACAEESLPVRGLMTLAPIGADDAALRRVFAGLRELRDAAAERGECGALPELSMGMTDDYEIAVEEGATMVRIGRALFSEPICEPGK